MTYSALAGTLCSSESEEAVSNRSPGLPPTSPPWKSFRLTPDLFFPFSHAFDYQITLRKGYGIPDLKTDMSNLYQKTGLKNLPTAFLMSDAQVADEKFLVLINNLLASGEIPDLFAEDEVGEQK